MLLVHKNTQNIIINSCIKEHFLQNQCMKTFYLNVHSIMIVVFHVIDNVTNSTYSSTAQTHHNTTYTQNVTKAKMTHYHTLTQVVKIKLV